MFYTPSPEPTYYPRHHTYSPKYHGTDDIHTSYRASSSSSSQSRYPHPSMRRSHTVGTQYVPGYEYGYGSSDAEPYTRMPHTYAWVFEQQIAEMLKENEETVRWVHEQQQSRETARDQLEFRILASGRRAFPTFEELLLHRPEVRARWTDSERRWKRWENEAEDTFQEEVRRLQEYRRQTERHRAAYERRKRVEEERERVRREREREREALKSQRREAEREAGNRYEARWTELLSSSETLGFHDVPWPMFSQPRSLQDITPAKVAMFVLSPLHPGESRRDKIRNALKRWHPDRFGRISARVEEADREAIEEGVGIVARCLNDLLERHSQ
ncbi:hypothetical protein OH76DRAFT_936389 [Lentinus brumalis]|uniref:Uncharacterized protein n=1 Tax=Lentinus brumalis TaxID=2498619 RepID=A0A371CZC3_9APHY|nr:hypothetical protein OH76DRAFT_936389 [Polyporus brumalis]